MIDSGEVFYVVDVRDDFVLFVGSVKDCENVVEEQYAGLMIFGYWDLTPGMIRSLLLLKGPSE